MKHWRYVTLLLLLSLGLWGCKSKEPATEPGLSAQSAPEESAESDPENSHEPQKEEAVKPMVPAGKDTSENPLVGGCRDACENPKEAFRGFIRKILANRPPEDLPEFRLYVDFSELEDNGRSLGTHWAQLWLDNQAEQRNTEVDRWVKEYRKRVGTVRSDPALEEALKTNTRFERVSSKLVRFEILLPALEDSKTESLWRIEMGKRGLEWLVRRIQDGSQPQETENP